MAERGQYESEGFGADAIADAIAVARPEIVPQQPGRTEAGSLVIARIADDASLAQKGAPRLLPQPRRQVPSGRPAPVVFLSELVVGALVLLVAEVAWVRLALAHLGAHSLWLVLSVSALLAAVTAAAVRRGTSRPRLRVDPGGS